LGSDSSSKELSLDLQPGFTETSYKWENDGVQVNMTLTEKVFSQNFTFGDTGLIMSQTFFLETNDLFSSIIYKNSSLRYDDFWYYGNGTIFTGKGPLFEVSNEPTAVEKAYDVGYADGKAEGYANGYYEGT